MTDDFLAAGKYGNNCGHSTADSMQIPNYFGTAHVYMLSRLASCSKQQKLFLVCYYGGRCLVR
eukprot:6196584-Pleurochrysis_carterae.AAC.2